MEVGICGEHGGDPSSIKFCHSAEGLTYVSASPHRIPIAIVAAAQAVIEQENIKKLKPKRKVKKIDLAKDQYFRICSTNNTTCSNV